MSKNVLFFSFIIFACFSFTMHAQDRQKVIDEKSLTWLGIDYTQARFTLVTENPSKIVTHLLQEINALILAEPQKFKLKEFFHKTEVNLYLDLVNTRNGKIDSTLLIVPDSYAITEEDVKNIISSYNLPGKTGMGLVFIAENMNKPAQTGSFYVVFFDMTTKQIIYMEKKVAHASGGNFRNFWANSAYNVMKTWLNNPQQ